MNGFSHGGDRGQQPIEECPHRGLALKGPNRLPEWRDGLVRRQLIDRSPLRAGLELRGAALKKDATRQL